MLRISSATSTRILLRQSLDESTVHAKYEPFAQEIEASRIEFSIFVSSFQEKEEEYSQEHGQYRFNDPHNSASIPSSLIRGVWAPTTASFLPLTITTSHLEF